MRIRELGNNPHVPSTMIMKNIRNIDLIKKMELIKIPLKININGSYLDKFNHTNKVEHMQEAANILLS